MIHVIVRVAVFGLLLIGAREFLESRAAKTLEVAQEQHQDEQHAEALDTLRSLDSWLSWTRAGAEGDVLRDQVRDALNQDRRRAEQDAQWDRQMAEMDRHAKERDERIERDRQHERYYAGLDESRRKADQEREMRKSREAAERINRNNERALRNAARSRN